MFWVKWDYLLLLVFLSAVKFVFFEVWNMLILSFHTFQRGFEAFNAIFQASVYVTIVTAIVYYNMYHC